MTARPLAPVIPLPLFRLPGSAPGPPRDGHCRWPGRCPCRLCGKTRFTGSAAYGIGRIDAPGRIADQSVITAMGWRGGDLLTLTADAGVVTARRDPGGMAGRSCTAIPAAPPLRAEPRRLGCWCRAKNTDPLGSSID